jgi:hypothetical protein
VSPLTQATLPVALLLAMVIRVFKTKRGALVTLLRPVTASLLLSIGLLAHTARWAATDPLRQEWTHSTQQQKSKN